MSLLENPAPASRIDIDLVREQALGCVRCPLSTTRTQVVWADGNLDSEVMFIGEAPGFHEDKQGKPFVGAAGQLLDRLMGEIGLDRTSCAIVNVLKCRPPNNRDPQPDEIESCTPHLHAQLAYMQPKVIVTLGNFATKFILQSQVGITKARGRKYLVRGSVVVPTFHPAAALRGGRFGGMSPIDAIREDLQVVKAVLEEAHAAERHAAESASRAAAAPARDDSQQLGLF